MRETAERGHGRSRQGSIAAVVGLGALVLGAWIFRFVGHDPVAPLDLTLYFYPIYEATAARLATGALPLWNPYQLCGIPWLATLQGGFFYPLHALYLVLPLPVALAASHVLHLLLVAFAMAAFARRAGLGASAAFLAAVLYLLRGMLPLSLLTVPYFEALVWLPVGAYATLGLVDGPALADVALLAVATALSLLAGYPQPTVYMIYAWGTLLATFLLASRPTGTRFALVCLAFGGALASGALAAAIQLGPTLELVHEGVHSSLSSDAMSPFGAVSGTWLMLSTGTIAGGAFAWGVPALALASAAPFSRRFVLAWWAIGLALLTAILSLGLHGPLYGLYRVLPPLASFRFPERILTLTDFAFTIAVAVGLDVVCGEESGATAATVRGRRTTAAVGAALATIALVVQLARHGHAPADRQAHVVVAALVVGIVLTTRLVSRRARSSALAVALACIVAADLWWSPWSQPMSYSADAKAEWGRYEGAYRALAARAGSDRAWVYGGLAGLQPSLARKLATRYRLRTIDDYEPLTTRRQAEYFNFFTDGTPTLQRWPWLFAGGIELPSPPLSGAPPATRRRLLDLTALRFVATPAAFPGVQAGLAGFLEAAGFERTSFADAGLSLFENPHVVPRAYVVYRTRAAPAPSLLLDAISREDFDPLLESYVEPAPGFSPAADATERGTPAAVVVDDERIVEVDATLSRPGLVVLADTFYPGWVARVDGTPVPILATNHLFRGVPAPAGRHRIRFEYHPRSLLFGAAGSAVGWLLIGTCAWSARRRASVRTDGAAGGA